MREVRSQNWGVFCDLVNKNGRGSSVALHKTSLDGVKTEIAGNVTFAGIAFGKRDDCNDRITISGSGEAAIQYEIVEPIHIKLIESNGGTTFPSVIIEAEEGTTQIDFHPMIKADWLKELDLQ
jgi:hypothetical protein